MLVHINCQPDTWQFSATNTDSDACARKRAQTEHSPYQWEGIRDNGDLPKWIRIRLAFFKSPLFIIFFFTFIAAYSQITIPTKNTLVTIHHQWAASLFNTRVKSPCQTYFCVFVFYSRSWRYHRIKVRIWTHPRRPYTDVRVGHIKPMIRNSHHKETRTDTVRFISFRYYLSADGSCVALALVQK